MGEKTGFTGKLLYDFPTEKSTEVFNEETGWVRVTCRIFRSYNALRRIVFYEKGEEIIQEYNGPIYLYMTNHVVSNPTIYGTQYVGDIQPVSKPRKYEEFEK